MDSSRITFGRILRQARRTSLIDGGEPSQREFCQILKAQYNLEITHIFLSKLENNRVDIKAPEYDSLVQAVAEILGLDRVWLQQIRQQTLVESLDSTSGIFPIYWRDSE